MFTFPKCAPHVASDRFFTAGSFAGFLPLKRKRRTLGQRIPRIQSAFKPASVILTTSVTHDSNFVF
jgi:hypothetical protein